MSESDHDLAMKAVATPHKGVVLSAEYKKINNPNASGGMQQPGAGMMHVLRVRFSDGAEEFKHDIPNPGFTFGNPALHFLAACDAAPSRTEDARGTLIPIVPSDQEHLDGKGIAQPFMDYGMEKAAEAAWAPDPDDERRGGGGDQQP